MNLVIDIGNSSSKAGVYSKSAKERVYHSAFELNEILADYSITRAIISSVIKEKPDIIRLLQDRLIPLIMLSHNTTLPFTIKYTSPETLGTDRIAAIAAAYNLYHGINVVVIDAGSAITYDFLDSDSNYAGGNISPGIDMRFRALHDYTGRLPLVDKGQSFDLIGYNTESAIRSGVQSGLIFEINDYIRNLKKKYGQTEIIVTGGDGRFISEYLEEKHEYIPDLVLDGLNFLLNYNA